MWKIAGALWKNFLNLVLQNANKNRASDNHVSGKKPTSPVAYIAYSITIPIGRFPKIVNGCKEKKELFFFFFFLQY